MNANILAHLVLLLWVPFAIVVFAQCRPTVATIVVLFGGAMFLPERLVFDFPAVPPLDKHVIAALGALLGCLIAKPHLILRPQPTSAARWLFILLFIGNVGTVVTNRDTLRYGVTTIPGLENYDILSSGINTYLHIVLPFFLGQTLFRTFDDLRDLVFGLVWSGIVYSPFIMFESRFSPQLHTWIYGYFQHDFLQAIRSGGFRPFVFMGHGLAVAMLTATAVFAAAILPTIRQTVFRRPSLTLAFLVVVLILCKSMGVVIFAVFALPATKFLRPETRIRVAGWLGLFVLCYPLARFFDLISTQWFIDMAAKFSEERSLSLDFRFFNENMLLQKAQERVWFGWGGWGRGRVYDFEGRDISVTDGEWIIQLCDGGAFAFLTVMGSLLAPIRFAKKAMRRGNLTFDELQLLAALTLIIALTGVDLIPNSMWTSLPYFMTGALASISAGVLARNATQPRVTSV